MQDHPALVLNADFRPLSYFPLSLLSWQDTITAVFKEHVSVVAEYDKWVSSPSIKMRLPSVVAIGRTRHLENHASMDSSQSRMCARESQITSSP